MLNFSPELFDYDQLIGKDTTSTLQHAFTVGQEQLGILRLLDPEGLHYSVITNKRNVIYAPAGKLSKYVTTILFDILFAILHLLKFCVSFYMFW